MMPLVDVSDVNLSLDPAASHTTPIYSITPFTSKSPHRKMHALKYPDIFNFVKKKKKKMFSFLSTMSRKKARMVLGLCCVQHFKPQKPSYHAEEDPDLTTSYE